MRRKLFAILTALTMALSLLPTPALAFGIGIPITDEMREAVEQAKAAGEAKEETAAVPAGPEDHEPVAEAPETEDSEDEDIDTLPPDSDDPVMEVPEAGGDTTADETKDEPAEEEELVEDSGDKLAGAPGSKSDSSGSSGMYEIFLTDDGSGEEEDAKESEDTETPEAGDGETVTDGEYAIAVLAAVEFEIDEDEENTVTSSVDTARLVDHGAGGEGAADPETDKTPEGKYEVTDNGKQTIEGTEIEYRDLTLTAYDVEMHYNSGHQYGKWIGVGFFPSEGVSGKISFDYSKGTMKSAWAGETPALAHNQTGLDPKVDGEKNGLAFYMDTNPDASWTHYADGEAIWIAIQWSEGGPVELYKITIKITKPVESVPDPDPDPVPEPDEEEDLIPDRNDDDRAPASGAASSTAPAAPAAPKTDTGSGVTKAEAAAEVTITSDGAAKAEVKSEAMNTAITSAVTEAAKQGAKPVVEVVVRTTAETKSLNVKLPAASLKTLAQTESASLSISSGVAAVTLDHTALAAVAGAASGGTVTLEVAPVAAAALNDAQKTAVTEAAGENAAVVDLALLSDGVEIADYGEGSITVSLPFTLPAGMSAANIVVYFLAADGTLIPRETVFADGQVTFVTTRMGEYVIGTK